MWYIIIVLHLPSLIDNVIYSDSDETSTIYPPWALQYDFASENVTLLSSASRYHLRFDSLFHGEGQSPFTVLSDYKNCFISHCNNFLSLNIFYNSAVISEEHALTANYLPQIDKCKSNAETTRLSFWATMIFTICNCTNIDYRWWTKHLVQVFKENGSE